MKKLLFGTVGIILLSLQSAFAYTPQQSDINLGYELSERLIAHLQQDNWSTHTYDLIVKGLAGAKNRIQSNERYTYILQIASDAVYDINKKAHNTTYLNALKSFRQQYDDDMQTLYDQPNNLSACFDHYPLVDEYARKTNKPTPLILAMWYIESSCAMTNPGNRDGLFQIINNDYEPGQINRAGLQAQLDDFARFMDNKWSWYYKRNPDAPKELGYTSFNYNSLQTFAALYNGMDLDVGTKVYPLLNANPYYFLSNYTTDYKGKRDGLLVFFMKLSKLEAEYFGK